MNPDRSIPLAVLKGAKGLAILTVAKAGVLLAYKLGTGLVIARRSDGSWSAPSAIVSVGMGWGAQVSRLSAYKFLVCCCYHSEERNNLKAESFQDVDAYGRR